MYIFPKKIQLNNEWKFRWLPFKTEIYNLNSAFNPFNYKYKRTQAHLLVFQCYI